MNKRLLILLRLFMISSPMRRASYLKEKNVFHHMGDRVMLMPRKIPLYSKLISIGNNVWIASGVEFITHDVAHYMLNGINDGNFYQEKIGCIKIGNNVFVGSGSKIMYDTEIGDNVIIAAGAVVTKDIPSGTVVGGIPAKVIGSFEEFLAKRRKFHVDYPADNVKLNISKQCEKEAWEQFFKKHKEH